MPFIEPQFSGAYWRTCLAGRQAENCKSNLQAGSRVIPIGSAIGFGSIPRCSRRGSLLIR
jgi:hypothetical protein